MGFTNRDNDRWMRVPAPGELWHVSALEYDQVDWHSGHSPGALVSRAGRVGLIVASVRGSNPTYPASVSVVWGGR